MAHQIGEAITQQIPALSGLHRQCPACGSERLMVVSSVAVMGIEAAQNVLCTACSRCWYVEDGRLEQVDRYLCPGCPERLRCFQPLIYGGVGTRQGEPEPTNMTRGGRP